MPPKSTRKKLHVIKVPLDYTPTIHPPNFPSMPRLYMELLENKKKVKPELRNKEYIPNVNTTQYSGQKLSIPSLREAETKITTPIILPEDKEEIRTKAKKDKKGGEPLRIVDLSSLTEDELTKIGSEKVKEKFSSSREKYNTPSPSLSMKQSPKYSSSSTIQDNDDFSFQESRYSRTEERSKNKYEDEYPPEPRNDDRQRNRQDKYAEEEKRDNKYQEEYDQKYDDREDRRDKSSSKTETSDGGLEDLLRGKDIPSLKEQKQSQSPTTSPPQMPAMAPSIAEINAGKVQRDGNGVRNMEYITKDEEYEASKKRDLLFKFRILRKKYKDASVPEFNEYSDLKTMQREYDNIVRQLSLDSTVENYKKYLHVAFILLEFIMVSLVKFQDFKGYATQQLLAMNQYESILYEIGEKSVLDLSKRWSPELRLLGIVLFNAFIFVGTKMLFKATGENLSAIFNQPAQGQSHSHHSSDFSHSSRQQTGTRARMKPPTVDLNDLGNKKSN